MSKQVRLRRGTTADHATFTGADGEITFNTDLKCLVVPDGVTPGGAPLTDLVTRNGDQTLNGLISFVGGTPGYGGSGLFAVNTSTFEFAEVLTLFRCAAFERAHSVLTYAATMNLPFDLWSLAQVNLGGNVTFTTSGLRSGRELSLIISAGASLRTFTFPLWLFFGSAAPASIAANKTGLLRLISAGTTDQSVLAQWIVQP